MGVSGFIRVSLISMSQALFETDVPSMLTCLQNGNLILQTTTTACFWNIMPLVSYTGTIHELDESKINWKQFKFKDHLRYFKENITVLSFLLFFTLHWSSQWVKEVSKSILHRPGFSVFDISNFWQKENGLFLSNFGFIKYFHLRVQKKKTCYPKYLYISPLRNLIWVLLP